MKHTFLLFATILALAACEFPDPPQYGGSIEEAPIMYTKEGFPIIDDQAPIPFPCPPVLVTPSTDGPDTTTVGEPPVSEPPTSPKLDKSKSNSGRGNGSEGDPDIDPGNSGSHNQGGD